MFRFVHTSNPTQAGKEQRLVRSHASREAYAKIRRARVANYLTLSSTTTTNNNPAVPSPATTGKSNLVPDPILSTNLPAGRVDPFDAFVAPLRPIESYLLDHCEFPSCHPTQQPPGPARPGLSSPIHLPLTTPPRHPRSHPLLHRRMPVLPPRRPRCLLPPPHDR